MSRTQRASCSIIVLVLVCALLASPTLALRASPAQVIIPQDSDGTFTIRVLDVQDPADITVIVGGDFASFVTINPVSAHPDGGVTIRGRLILPDDATPGDHVQELIIGAGLPAAGGTVTARAELAIPLIARIPYPDAYLVAYWDAQADPGSGATHLTVTLENRGRIAVTTGEILMRFTDGTQELPALDFAPLTIGPGAFARDDAVYTIPDGTSPGEYETTLTVPYASTTLTERKTMLLGTPRITIENVNYDMNERGAIVPVDVSGTVLWNRPLTLDTAIYLDEATVPAATDRTTVIPGAFTRRLYVDTEVVGRPQGSLRAIIVAGSSSAERSSMIAAPVEPEWEMSPLAWMVGALLVCVLVAIGLVLLSRRRTPPST